VIARTFDEGVVAQNDESFAQNTVSICAEESSITNL
jgi:hypothetical protein